MGLLENVLAKQMHLSWVDDGKGPREIKPGWYLAVEFNYNSPPQKTSAEIKEDTESWLVELAALFESVPAQSRYLSGPLGVFALADDWPWLETYTEISIFAQKPILQALVTAGRSRHYHLMRRISGKFSIKSQVKYHFFHPATIEDALGPRRQPRRNLELTRIDPAGNMICQEFIPRNHIRLCLHNNSGDHITCTGDKQPIHYPREYFRGIARSIGGKRMFVIDPRYMLLKEKEAIKTGATRHPERHQEITKSLEKFLAQHP